MKKPFNVGDLVTSDFGKDKRIIRKVTMIEKDKSCGSGWRASADGGEVCPHCGRVGTHIVGVDSEWFDKVEPKS